ncbi:hypothetical protein RB597_000790 [Gaeumannomyces tritici]
MDVTALLNSGAKLGQLSQMAQLAQLGPRGEPLDLTPTPSVISNTTAASTGVATPPPEKSPSRSNSESRTPNRSRTPWDAGGYSLPLTLDTKMIRTRLMAKPVLYGDSPPGEHHPDSNSPSSPKHKFSDSRSSLSSYTTTSSNNSGSHSRISSLSTVSEFQPMTSLITDFSSLEAKMSDETERQSLHNSSASSVIHGGDAVMRSGLGNDDGMLGAGGMGGGMMDGRLQQPLSPYSMKLEVPGDSGTSHSSENESISEQQRSDRARSPSDAILFTSNNAQPPRGPVVETGRRSIDPFGAGYQPGHKRAVSAPDFPSTVRTRYQPPVGFAAPIVEPPYSPNGFYQQSFSMGDNQPRRPSLTEEDDAYAEDPSASGMQTEHASHGNAVASSAHVEDWNDGTDDSNDSAVRAMNDDALCEASDYEDGKPSRCLWGNVPCDTGSQLRKAVSHIFGRNKLCTRQIPDLAWVHFCRKHYQRARYRLGPNYALTQVRLVIRQINKIRKWSDHNVANGHSSGVVNSWRIQLRKREERRQETKGQTKKRSRGDDDDMGGMDGMDGNEDVKAEQPPQWLIEKVGDGYTTEQVLNVAWRLKEDLHNKLYTRIPDVEILPNITSDRTEEAKPRAKAPRRNAPAGQPLRSAPNRSRMGPYAGYQGHRSTLSESARGGMGHLADMASFSGWDSPAKRQRGQEYDNSQLSRPWMTQQATATLPIRPAQDLGSYATPMASGASGYNYMSSIPQARGSTGYAVQPGGWGAPASTNTGSYGSNMGFATQPQLSPVPTSAAGQPQHSPYFAGSGYATTQAQQQQPSPAFFGTGAYGNTATASQSAPRGIYDGWGGYAPQQQQQQQQHHGANTARNAQHQQQAARSHQRHVSAPWPNSGMMGGSQNSYQFGGAAAAIPQFTAGPPMDPALLGGSQQRRSSLPHNAAAPTAPMMSAPQAGATQPQAGTGNEHNTGYDMSQHQAHQAHLHNPNARYDIGRR